MSGLAVDYCRLYKKAERLGSLYLDLKAEMDALADAAEGMDIFWDGDANAVFMRTLGEDLVEMGVIMMGIRNAVATCRKAMDIYMKNEKEVKNVIGELKI